MQLYIAHESVLPWSCIGVEYIGYICSCAFLFIEVTDSIPIQNCPVTAGSNSMEGRPLEQAGLGQDLG